MFAQDQKSFCIEEFWRLKLAATGQCQIFKEK